MFFGTVEKIVQQFIRHAGCGCRHSRHAHANCLSDSATDSRRISGSRYAAEALLKYWPCPLPTMAKESQADKITRFPCPPGDDHRPRSSSVPPLPLPHRPKTPQGQERPRTRPSTAGLRRVTFQEQTVSSRHRTPETIIEARDTLQELESARRAALQSYQEAKSLAHAERSPLGGAGESELARAEQLADGHAYRELLAIFLSASDEHAHVSAEMQSVEDGLPDYWALLESESSSDGDDDGGGTFRRTQGQGSRRDRVAELWFDRLSDQGGASSRSSSGFYSSSSSEYYQSPGGCSRGEGGFALRMQ